MRPDVSIDLDDFSRGSSGGTSSSASTDAGCGTEDQGDHMIVSAVSCSSHTESEDHPEAAGIAALNTECMNNRGILEEESGTDGTPEATASADQAIDESNLVDDVDMVHLYPEYLLHGVGLKLLQLCMAMWARDPRARPSCEDILEQLAVL